MKRIRLIIICLVSTITGNAQSLAFQWAKNMGGAGVSAAGSSIVLDGQGYVYTTGTFRGTVDFDPGPGVFNLTSMGDAATFISKLDAAGNFIWAKSIGGTAASGIFGVYSYSIALDAGGNIYTTGYFLGTDDFDPNAGIYNMTAGVDGNQFILKLDPVGNFVWAKNIIGTSLAATVGFSITLDASGSIYTTGYFDNGIVDFDPGAGTFNLTPVGINDMFISKLDASGNFLWAKGIGSSGSSINGTSIKTDASGIVYTTGYFQGTAHFGSSNLISSGADDIFISKMDASGNFIWAKRMGGNDDSRGYSIAIDESGNVYITGLFKQTTDFDPGTGVYDLTAIGDYDIYVSKSDGSGNFIWAKDIGGSSYDSGNSIALDADNNIYTTGWFYSTVDFDPGTSVFNLTAAAGVNNMFISKLDSLGNFLWAGAILGSANSSSTGSAIALDASRNVYTTGNFAGTADFDPGFATDSLNSAASENIFVHKMNQVSTSGINEYSDNNNISIYPNPANGVFHLKINGSGNSKLKELKVYNVLSECVYQLTQEQLNASSDLNIDLTSQSNGIYFVKVMDDDKIMETYKIIKQ